MTEFKLNNIVQALQAAPAPKTSLQVLDTPQLQFCAEFSDIGAIFKSNSDSTDLSVQGLVTGLAYYGGALWEAGILGVGSGEQIRTQDLAAADTRVTEELELVLAELEVWYPAITESLNLALEDPFHKGMAAALLTYHNWARAAVGEANFNIKYLTPATESPFTAPAEPAVPEPAVFAAEPAPAPDTVEETDVAAAVLDRLIQASETGASFRFDLEDDVVVIRIICPDEFTVRDISALGQVFGSVRLNSDNDVISLTADLF